MNTPISRTTFTAVTIFVALAVAFAVLTSTAEHLSDPFAQAVMMSVGSAIFGSGLTFFLIRVSSVDQRN